MAPLERSDGLGLAAIPARQRDVRVKGATLRRGTGSDAGALDLPDVRWRRDRVLALVSAAPLRHEPDAS